MKFFPYPKIAAFFAPPLLIAAIAAGCGGGGGSSPGPTPTPTLPASCDASTFTPNFVSSVTLLRWTRFPLRVFFVRDANYTAARQTLAQSGFNEWVQATGGKVTYTVVSDPSVADITVTFFIFTGGSGDELGSTAVTFTQPDNILQKADMSLGQTGNTADDRDTAAHEFGHALGIDGHSPNSADLMFAFGNTTGCGCITRSDLDTLLTAYCGRFGTARLPQSTGTVTRTVIHDPHR